MLMLPMALYWLVLVAVTGRYMSALRPISGVTVTEISKLMGVVDGSQGVPPLGATLRLTLKANKIQVLVWLLMVVSRIWVENPTPAVDPD